MKNILRKVFYLLFRLLNKIPEFLCGTSCPEQYIKKRFFLKYLNIDKNSTGKILDVGCGRGFLMMQLSKKYPKWKFYGVDINNEYLDDAKKRVEELKLRNIVFINASTMNSPFKNSCFDRIISTQVFEHFPAPYDEIFFEEVNRLLRETGLFVLNTTGDGFYSIFFILYWILSRFQSLRRKYKVLDFYYKYGFYPAYELHKHVKSGFSPEELYHIYKKTSLMLQRYHYCYKQNLSLYFQIRTLNKKLGEFFKFVGFFLLLLDELFCSKGLDLTCLFYKRSYVPGHVIRNRVNKCCQ